MIRRRIASYCLFRSWGHQVQKACRQGSDLSMSDGLVIPRMRSFSASVNSFLRWDLSFERSELDCGVPLGASASFAQKETHTNHAIEAHLQTPTYVGILLRVIRAASRDSAMYCCAPATSPVNKIGAQKS